MTLVIIKTIITLTKILIIKKIINKERRKAMSIYEELGVPTILNAAGTYTVLGGSKMSKQTLDDMADAAGSFVQIRILQKAVNSAVAKLTRNESAYISNGAATGLYLSIAAAIQMHLGKKFYYITKEEIAKTNIVMFKAHRNPYDLVIGHLGAQYRELSFPNIIFPPTEEDLRMAIDENTAAVYYAQSGWVAPGYLPLDKTIQIAGEKNIPVIVDAAAQLPPVENLWKFTEMGAAIALFSGGKDLKGPQASGLMVGKKELMDIVSSIGFPNYGIGRMMKVGREEMVGLYSAVKQYISLDHQARGNWCEVQVEKFKRAFTDSKTFHAVRSYPNEAGQPIPRVFLEIVDEKMTPEQVHDFLLAGNPSIYANSDGLNGIFINPMSLEEGDSDVIIKRLLEFSC